jgi:hypothetical protein
MATGQNIVEEMFIIDLYGRKKWGRPGFGCRVCW